MSGQNSGSDPRSQKAMDHTDLRILKLLVEDPRRSGRALAKEIGLSPSAVTERINQLEERGIITGYTTTVNMARLERPMTAYVGMTLELGPEHQERSRKLTEIPEVESVVLTTGEFDVLLKIRVRDIDHLNEVLFRKLIEGSVGLVKSHSMLSLQTFDHPNYVANVIDTLME